MLRIHRARFTTSLCAVSALALSAVAIAAPPAEFDRRVDSVREAAEVPGMAISIVEKGEITLARGYGLRELGKPEKVDGDTLFLTGSTGKAFTAAGLAVLVDRGLIEWDDKVIEHLPWFQMYDPWVTREITIRDLLVHRSGLGLGAGDLLFVPRTTRSRAEVVRQLRHIKPATSFRNGFAYDNVLYIVAGQLVEEVTGQTWEEFTVEQVLKPAGMSRSTADGPSRFATENRAQPHARVTDGHRGVGEQAVLDERDELSRVAAPAGGLASSANDLARWLLIQLADGKLPEGDGRLFSEAQAQEMWTPVVFLPIREYAGSLSAVTPDFSTYALGWNVRDYKGAKVVWHGGFTFGFKAAVVLIPEKQVGFSILTNAEDGSVVLGLMYELLDHYLGEPMADWPERFAADLTERTEKMLEALDESRVAAVEVGPSLPHERYAGDYTDAWYGPISIRLVDEKLAIDFRQTPGMTATLEHWQYDTFIARWDDGSIEPAYVTFGLDAEGGVDRILMKAVSPLADFSFDYQDLLLRPAR